MTVPAAAKDPALPVGAQHRTKTFLVLGAGGHGRVLADLVCAAGHRLLGFAEENPAKLGLQVTQDHAVILLQSQLFARVGSHGTLPFGAEAVALGIGDNRRRLEFFSAVGDELCPALVHPAAVVSRSARIGPGTVVLPGAVVNAGATIGRGVIVNTGAVVEHDCAVEDGAHLSPRATLAGGVRIGRCTWVGAGATVIENRTVSEYAVVGAGAVVLSDVRPGVTVVGVPARPLPPRGHRNTLPLAQPEKIGETDPRALIESS